MRCASPNRYWLASAMNAAAMAMNNRPAQKSRGERIRMARGLRGRSAHTKTSWPGFSRPSRPTEHRALLIEIAGTSPAMTYVSGFPVSPRASLRLDVGVLHDHLEGRGLALDALIELRRGRGNRRRAAGREPFLRVGHGEDLHNLGIEL